MAKKSVRVIAPATLAAGYTFDVLLDGRPYTVTVPANGVKEGQEFEIPYPDDYASGGAGSDSTVGDDRDDKDDDVSDPGTLPARSTSEDEENQRHKKSRRRRRHSADVDDDDDDGDNDSRDELGAPYGKWRTHLCSCCDVVTQATFWMALCCTPVLVAQLVTRLRLNWQGVRDTEEEASLSFNKIIMSFIAALVLSNVLPVAGLLVLGCYSVVLLFWVGRNLRRTMRRMYRIKSRLPCGDKFEDGFCMCLCGCCTLIQIARHTHDDKEYPGYCCTTTGLELAAPDIEME